MKQNDTPPDNGAPNKNTNGLGKDGQASEGMLALSASVAGPDAVPHYQRLKDNGRWRSRNRQGLATLGNRLLQAITFDAVERNRRIIVLASRSPSTDDAAGLATLLGAAHVWEGVRPSSLGRIQELMAEKLPDEDRGGEITVFVETTDQGCLIRGVGIGAQLQQDRRDEDEIRRMEQFLLSHDSWLIVLFDLGGQAHLPSIASAITGCYVFPWILGWFQDIDQVSGVAADAFDRLQQRLLDACDVSLPPQRSVELQLFGELTELSKTAPAFGLDKLIGRIETALVNAASDSDDRRQAAERRLDALFDERLNIASKGEIGRTLFTVSLLTERQPYASVIWLTSHLLPEGEAPIDLLPTSLLSAWQREADDSERLMRHRPSLPDWRTLFLHDPDSALLACGLHGEAGQIKRDSIFQQIDVLAVLYERRRVFLQTLLNRMGERRLYALVPSEHAECLVHCHILLARTLGAVDEKQTILTFCGMKPTEQDLPLSLTASLQASSIVSRAAGTQAMGHMTTLADVKRCIEHLSDPSPEALPIALDLRKLERPWRREAVETLATNFMTLKRIFVAQSGPQDMLDAWIGASARVLSQDSLWLLLALLTFRNAAPSPKALGRAIFESLKASSQDSRPQRISDLKHIWEVLFYSSDKSIEDGTALSDLSPLEIWPDGLNAFHEEIQDIRRWPWLSGLTTYADDFFSNCEIGWNFRLEENRRSEPSIMASRLFLNGATEEACSFIIRLLCRQPEDWLEAMEDFSRAMTETGKDQSRFHADRHFQERLSDVFAMLLGATDSKARDHVRSGNMQVRLRAMTWRTISDRLATTTFDNERRGTELALTACRPDAPNRRLQDMEILRLYPCAVFAEWRFMAFGPGRINRDSSDYEMIVRVMLHIRSVLREKGLTQAISACFAALAQAQVVLSSHFSDHRFAQTADLYCQKAQTLQAMAEFLVPPDLTNSPLPKPKLPPLLAPSAAARPNHP